VLQHANLGCKGSTQFFLEKKNQKTLIRSGPHRLPGESAKVQALAKVFCFFFSKKKDFLAS